MLMLPERLIYATFSANLDILVCPSKKSGVAFLTKKTDLDRLGGGPVRDPREALSRVRPSSRASWPSPAELPSKLQRVSEPAQREDLEDFNGISLDFPRISSSAGAEPS